MSNNVDNFLAHYGVRGMKWGVNRAAKKAATQQARREVTKGKSLDELVERRRKEKTLKKLLDDDLNPKRTAGKNFVSSLMKENQGALIAGLTTGASVAIGTAFMAYKINQSFSGISLSPIPLR